MALFEDDVVLKTLLIPTWSECRRLGEATPDSVSSSTAGNVVMDDTPGSQNRGVFRHDVSSIAGKYIAKAFLLLANDNNFNKQTESRTLSVHKVLRPWVAGSVTWNNYDGTNPWASPGGMGTGDIVPYIGGMKVVRVSEWQPNWFLDVTEAVRDWVEGGETNNGLMVTVTGGEQKVFRLKTGYVNNTPGLLIFYSDTKIPKGRPLSEKVKLQVAADYSTDRYGGHAQWDWSAAIMKNAQAEAHRIGWGLNYLTEMLKYWDYYIDAAGAFIGDAQGSNFATDTVAGPALVYAYSKTFRPQYKTVIDVFRALGDTAPKTADGLFAFGIGNNATEIHFFALPFFAAYGDYFEDSASTDIAVTQSIGLFDKLMNSQPDNIPFHKRYGSTQSFSGKGWARGMGWMIMGIAKVLEYKAVKSHSRYAELRSRFITIARSFKAFQDSNGLWHNFIHQPNTKYDTSGTAMIALAYEIGVQEDILDSSFRDAVDSAKTGLLRESLTGLDVQNAYPANVADAYDELSKYQNTDYGYGAFFDLIVKIAQR